MSLLDCAINWDAPASLKDVRLPTQGFAWVGDHVYDGNVGGAVRKFKTLSREQKQRVEMLTDPEAIEGIAATIVSYDTLSILASRCDVPVH